MANVPPEEIPLWQTFPRKKSHGRISPGGKQYHMVKLPRFGKFSPHTDFMIREQIPWQIVPPEIIPYGKPSPGKKSHSRTSQGEIIPYGNPPPPPRKKSYGRTSPGGNNTIWQTFTLYGKSPPKQIPYVIFGQHVRFLFGSGGRNPIDWELLPYGIFSGGIQGGSHVTPDSPYSGNMVYPQQKIHSM